jgi:hypothetical protein
LGSGPPQKSRRLRFRFSDSTEDTEKTVVDGSEKLSSDDILDSLRKQSENSLEETGDMEEIIGDEDVEDTEQESGTSVMPASINGEKNSSHHRLGFGLIVFSGLVVVGIYEAFTRPSSALSLVRTVENVDARGIFGSLLQASIIALTGMVALGWMARHRRKHYLR